MFIDSIALSSVVIHINSKLIIFHFIISSLNYVIYVIELSKQEITNCIETNFQNYDFQNKVFNSKQLNVKGKQISFGIKQLNDLNGFYQITFFTDN